MLDPEAQGEVPSGMTSTSCLAVTHRGRPLCMTWAHGPSVLPVIATDDPGRKVTSTGDESLAAAWTWRAVAANL